MNDVARPVDEVEAHASAGASAADPRLAACRRLQSEVLDPLKRIFVDKDEVIDALGVALLASENLFILGPPGTAKSAIVQELARRLDGVSFEYLLTRFTEPNELFGPFDIRRLREGELVTNTEGMLPEADLVFLDEVMNANSAVLNSLLSVLNERVFRRGRETRALRTLAVVGASNRLPEDGALGALFDRFLLRVRCTNAPDERLPDVLAQGLALDLGLARGRAALSVEEVRAAQALLVEVDLAPVRARYADLVRAMRRAGSALSDRRAVKLQRAVAASALAAGRLRAMPADLWVCRHAWDTEEEAEVLTALVDRALGEDASAPGAHPRARAARGPAPDDLARELDAIADRLESAGLGAAEHDAMQERLGALAGRVAWVEPAIARGALEERVDGLLRRAVARARAR